MSAEIIGVFFKFQHLVKLFHWTTLSYSKHIATDKFIDKILNLIDKFVEIYIGKYGRPNVSVKMEIKNLNDDEMVTEFKKMIEYLNRLSNKYDKDTDLMNIRDEMVGEINQTLYLFTLN